MPSEKEIQSVRTTYITLRREGDRWFARRCAECGEYATTNAACDDGTHAVQGRLPRECVRLHDNCSVEVEFSAAEKEREGDDPVKLKAQIEALHELIADVASDDAVDPMGAAHVRMLLRKRLGDTAMYYQTRGFEDLLRAEAREGDIIEKLRAWAAAERVKINVVHGPQIALGKGAVLDSLDCFLNDLQEQSTGGEG